MWRCVQLPQQIENNPSASGCHISICRMSHLQLIPNMPSGHSALVLACLLNHNIDMRRPFRQSRDGTGLGERVVHVRSGGESAGAYLVRSLRVKCAISAS
jgi:hypothetical protein